MLLDPQKTPVRLEEDGSTLYFCSRGCRKQYEEEGRKQATAVRVDLMLPS
jgi:YHS domain-containing protein